MKLLLIIKIISVMKNIRMNNNIYIYFSGRLQTKYYIFLLMDLFINI